MKWIDLKQQQPPFDTPVLVFRQTFNIHDAIYYAGTGTAVYTFPPGAEKTAGNGKFPFDDVTHWMPLTAETRRLSEAELIRQYVAQFEAQ